MKKFTSNLNFLISELSVYSLSASLKVAIQAWLNRGSSEFSIELLHQLLSETGIPAIHLLERELENTELAKTIRLVVFDVDGVLTDAGMYYSEQGDELKRFNAKDGLAIRQLSKQGFITGVISHGINVQLITRRCELLGISKVYAGSAPKQDILASWCSELGISLSEVAYIGDDINDLPIMRLVGHTACPADASELVKQEADLLLLSKGGQGAVREWIERCFLPMNA